MRYLVHIEGAAAPIAVELANGQATLDGVARAVRLTAIPGTPLYELDLAGHSHTVAALRQEDAWALVVHGTAVLVRVGSDREPAVGTPARPRGAGTLTAPLPGLIVRVAAAEGQRVETGMALVVMEAMKMENELRAPGPGTVKRVLVTAGQRVERGAPLVEFTNEA